MSRHAPKTGGAFCLILHTHLPYVLNHGRWPHGADWLNEAVIESYIPTLEAAQHLVRHGVSPRWTVGLSPVLVEQLAAPAFQRELQFFLAGLRLSRGCLVPGVPQEALAGRAPVLACE